jgi:hypothetical protein
MVRYTKNDLLARAVQALKAFVCLPRVDCIFVIKGEGYDV